MDTNINAMGDKSWSCSTTKSKAY